MVVWHSFDYDNKKETAPPAEKLVWIYEEFYEQGVTTGFFDGFTFCVWTGSDDCHVSHWAFMEYPDKPKEIAG